MLPAALVAGVLTPEFAAAATAAGAFLVRYGARVAPYLQRLPHLFNTAAEEMPYVPNALDRAGKFITTGAAAVAVIASEAGEKPESPQENPTMAAAAASAPLPPPPTR